MTQPWLKIYPERMRGDAALAQLTDQEQMWLIHCWHIAANQEADTHYGHLRLPNGAPYDYAALAAVLRQPPKKVNEFMLKLVALRIAIVEDDSDFALTFPNLRTWQAKEDPSNAERQRRYRNAHSNAPRNAQSNAESNAPVTPIQKTEERRKKKAVQQRQSRGDVPAVLDDGREHALSTLIVAVGDSGDKNTGKSLRGIIWDNDMSERDIHRAREAVAAGKGIKNLARYAAGTLQRIAEEAA